MGQRRGRSNDLAQRGDQRVALRRGADGDAQVVGDAFGPAELPHDDGALAQGLVSYSYYLWHLPVLRWIVETEWFRSLEGMRFLSLLLVSAPLIFVISTLSYVLVEAPGMRFRRRDGRA